MSGKIQYLGFTVYVYINCFKDVYRNQLRFIEIHLR